jgi:ubiquitin C-terminal hydrolase
VIPNDDTEVTLRDGESIAVDWHFVVYEELVDYVAASEISKHSSLAIEAERAENTGMPLSRCFEKFTEEEKLEGVVCPACKDDSKMKKSIALWRMPPVLLVQLKRFQFDQVSRRKLTNKVTDERMDIKRKRNASP